MRTFFNEDYYNLIIKEWVYAVGKDEVHKYITTLIEKHPNYVAKIIKPFVIKWPESGDNQIRYDELCLSYKVDELYLLVEEKGADAYSSVEEKRLLNYSRKFMLKYRKEKRSTRRSNIM